MTEVPGKSLMAFQPDDHLPIIILASHHYVTKWATSFLKEFPFLHLRPTSTQVSSYFTGHSFYFFADLSASALPLDVEESQSLSLFFSIFTVFLGELSQPSDFKFHPVC